MLKDFETRRNLVSFQKQLLQDYSTIHMRTFTYPCKFYIYVNFTHLCKTEHVNANTYPSIFTYVQIYSWVLPSVKVFLPFGQSGLSLTWSQTPEDRFSRDGVQIYYHIMATKEQAS